MNKYFDSTLLKPEATADQIRALCREAKEYHFAAVCVNPCYVSLAAEELAGSDVDIATVIGFPLGAPTTQIKVAETADAITNGATEIDMVMNIGAFKSGDEDAVRRDIRVHVGEDLLSGTSATAAVKPHKVPECRSKCIDCSQD